MDLRGAAFSLRAFDSGKRARHLRQKPFLLIRRTHHDGVVAVPIPERCEDLSVDAKVRMAHVRGLHGVCLTESDLAELAAVTAASRSELDAQHTGKQIAIGTRGGVELGAIARCKPRSAPRPSFRRVRARSLCSCRGAGSQRGLLRDHLVARGLTCGRRPVQSGANCRSSR